jgi:O-antigen ligase
MVAFVVAVGLATIFAPHAGFAFWSSLERMDGFISVLFLAAFFFSARALFDAGHWKTFWNISIGVALVVSGVALLQLAGVIEIHQGVVRIDATLGNAAFFAVYMLLSAGLALFLGAGAERKKFRVFYFACAALFVFLALASATRSAFVALPIGLCVSAIVALRFSLRRFGVVVLLLLALFAGTFFVAREIPALRAHPLVGRLLSVSFSGQDVEARLLAWNIVLKGAVERPFLGWGPEGFRYAFARHYDPALYGREQWFDRAHNNYMDWLVQAGAFGLLAYLALWFGLVRGVWRGSFSSWEKVSLVGMCSAYAAFNMFSFDTLTASIIFFSFLAYVDWRVSQDTKQNSFSGSASRNTDIFLLKNSSCSRQPRSQVSARHFRSTSFVLQNAFRVALVVIAFFIFYYAIAKPASAAYLIHEGLQNPSPNLDERLSFFERAIALHTFTTPEAREFLAQFAVDVEPVLSREESRGRVVGLVHEELALQSAESPDDPRYPLRLGVVLNTYRQYKAAIPFIERALELSPHKQPSLYELGTSYLNLGQFEKAVEVFGRAAQLLPENQDRESKLLYAISLVYARRFADADAYMQRIFGISPFIDSRLADAYARSGRSESAVLIRAEIARQKRGKDNI